MSDRIQRALDGDLPLDSLSAEERSALDEYRRAIAAAAAPVEQLPPVNVGPAVMRRIGSMPVPGGPLARMGALLWAPRPVSVRVRPALALAASLAVLALAGVLGGSLRAAAAPPAVARQGAPVTVQFRLGDADAREVALVGDFNGWQPVHHLRPIAAGVWAVDVTLEPGIYTYTFLVDGTTVRLDPLAPQVADGFGGASSRVAVARPEHRL